MCVAYGEIILYNSKTTKLHSAHTHTTVEPQHSHDVTTEVESFTHLLKYV